MTYSSSLIAPILSTTFGAALLGISIFTQPASADDRDRLGSAYKKASDAASGVKINGRAPTGGGPSSSPSSSPSNSGSPSNNTRTTHFNTNNNNAFASSYNIALRYNSEGLKWMESKNYEKAYIAFYKAVKEAPNDPVLRGNFDHADAMYQFEYGHYHVAIAAMREAINKFGRTDLIPTYAEILNRDEKERRGLIPPTKGGDHDCVKPEACIFAASLPIGLPP